MKSAISNKGFTLIEVMIVVAIIAIIAAIGYPSYQESVYKSRRADGRAALQEAAARQERIYVESNSYTSDVAKLVSNGDGSSSPEGYYGISVSLSCDRTVGGATYYSCFTLTATPQGAQAGDTDCTTLTLTHTGVKGATGGGTTCW
ncbi:MAG: type IV pilin protein [Pseudomonadota bacterium]|nr:type IV pilin protein [Pseudomonadota bacterium]